MSGIEVNLRCGDTVTVASMPAIGAYRYCEHCDGRRQVIGVPVITRPAVKVPTLRDLHDGQFAMGSAYIDGQITDSEFNWQWHLYGALVTNHLAQIHHIFSR